MEFFNLEMSNEVAELTGVEVICVAKKRQAKRIAKRSGYKGQFEKNANGPGWIARVGN